MKKNLFMFLTLTVTMGILSGCTGTPVTSKPHMQEEETKEHAAAERTPLKTGLSIVTSLTGESASEGAEGTAATDISIVAVTVNDSGIIESCVIDEIQGKISFDEKGQLTAKADKILSKNELGEGYGMKQASSVGKEWNEQAAALAKYAEGKTAEELQEGAIDENGKAKDADLASSATIYLGGLLEGILEAAENAEHLGAGTGDLLVLTAVTSAADSRSATTEEEGSASVTSEIAAMTLNGEQVTSCIIDSVQSHAFIGADGTFHRR